MNYNNKYRYSRHSRNWYWYPTSASTFGSDNGVTSNYINTNQNVEKAAPVQNKTGAVFNDFEEAFLPFVSEKKLGGL